MRIIAALLLLLPAGSMTAQDHATLKKLGQKYVDLFYKENLAPLWNSFNDTLKSELQSIENLQEFRKGFATLAEKETDLLSETVSFQEGRNYYVRQVRFEKAVELFKVSIGFDSQLAIADFHIRPVEAGEDFHYINKNIYRLPFTGKWYVASGGRTREDNANHYHDFASRFAIDFVRVEDTIHSLENPEANAGYKSFGSEILAPASGKVVAIQNEVADNLPGTVNKKDINGNYIILDHGKGEYSLMAHLQQGSIRVKPGQIVGPGQLLARCGNSGNSNGPHLHFSLINKPDPLKTMSLPAQFSSFTCDGRPVEKGEVRKGNSVSNQ